MRFKKTRDYFLRFSKITGALFLFSFHLFIGSCKGDLEKEGVLVAIASSMQFPLKEIAADFEKRHKIPIELIQDASGRHVNRILNGAPYNLFISADHEYSQKLAHSGKTAGPIRKFASGQLIFYAPRALNLNFPGDLRNKKFAGKIAIADPKFAPYGRIALQYLKEKGLYDTLQERLIYADSVSQVNRYLRSGTVDAAFTASGSDPTIMKREGKNSFVVVDTDSGSLIEYTVVLLNAAGKQEMAGKFADELFSSSSKKIFENFGFVPVKENPR